jgi:hemolysin activation/secretion protein
MKPFFRLSGRFGFYLPLLKNLSLASNTGISTLTEDADFNQLNRLGGGSTFRGYLRFRFYGKTSFLNSNELQWSTPVKSYIMNGKIGLVGFFDNGRVWHPGEVSDTWHISYGGGVLLSPFNKIVAVGTYGITKEGNRINFRLGRLF